MCAHETVKVGQRTLARPQRPGAKITKEVAQKGEHIDTHGETIGLEGLAVSNVGKDVLHNRDGPWVADFKVIV